MFRVRTGAWRERNRPEPQCLVRVRWARGKSRMMPTRSSGLVRVRMGAWENMHQKGVSRQFGPRAYGRVAEPNNGTQKNAI